MISSDLHFIQECMAQRQLSERDALQIFMQYVVLKNLLHPTARLIGGTALVLGYNNPRFSEDIDLTHVAKTTDLQISLKKACQELSRWFKTKVLLISPKKGLSTWRLQYKAERFVTISLHVDSQTIKPLTAKSIVVDLPKLSPIIVPSLDVAEIMADKLVALAFRSYIGGRDLFDLWFHWFNRAESTAMTKQISEFLLKKLKQRQIKRTDFETRIRERTSLLKMGQRVVQEFERYLPQPYQHKALHQEIINECKKIPARIGL